MNAQISLSFRNVSFDITDIHGQPWLRGLQVASALGYKNPAADIVNLYNRNADEFTDSMTQVIELPTAGGKQQVRVFSLRGCHLLGMLARTKVAKEFRRWVLDVLEKEVSGSPKLETQTTIDERRGLVEAVKAFAIRRNLDFPTAYRMVHQRFGVAHIDQIAAPLLPAAVAYVHSLTLQNGLNGEVLDRLPENMQPKPNGITFSEQQVSRFGTAVYFLDWATHQLAELSIPLKMLGAREKGVAAHTLWSESQSWLKHCRAALQEAQAQMHDPYYRDHLAGSLQKMANLSA